MGSGSGGTISGRFMSFEKHTSRKLRRGGSKQPLNSTVARVGLQEDNVSYFATYGGESILGK